MPKCTRRTGTAKSFGGLYPEAGQSAGSLKQNTSYENRHSLTHVSNRIQIIGLTPQLTSFVFAIIFTAVREHFPGLLHAHSFLLYQRVHE